MIEFDASDLPNQVSYYRDKGLISFGDFLGTNNIATRDREYLSYDYARKHVKKLQLKNKSEWFKYWKCQKQPYNIPRNGQHVYQYSGWISWGDFLGSKNFKSGWMQYNQAQEYICKLNIQSQGQWYKYANSNDKPNNIPSSPSGVYRDKGWTNWGDFLGTGYISHQCRIYLSYEDVREFARKLKIKSRKEWSKYCKSNNKPDNIPKTPEHIYKNNGWEGWASFLGTNNKRGGWLSHKDAKEFVHRLKLKSTKEWFEHCKSNQNHKNIPTNPQSVYKNKGWISWGDWLGTGYICGKYREYLSYVEAKDFAHKLKLKTRKEWLKYVKLNNIPNNIPNDPRHMYITKGWTSWPDFLGTNK